MNFQLSEASFSGDVKSAKELIEAGADVNHINEDGSTALICASHNGHTEIVKALVEAGADVNHKNDYDSTALMYASEKGHAEMVSLLLKGGATVTDEIIEKANETVKYLLI